MLELESLISRYRGVWKGGTRLAGKQPRCAPTASRSSPMQGIFNQGSRSFSMVTLTLVVVSLKNFKCQQGCTVNCLLDATIHFFKSQNQPTNF